MHFTQDSLRVVHLLKEPDGRFVRTNFLDISRAPAVPPGDIARVPSAAIFQVLPGPELALVLLALPHTQNSLPLGDRDPPRFCA